MNCLKFFGFWNTVTKLSAAISRPIIDFLLLVLVEVLKYCAVLLITFGLGYLIFYYGDADKSGSFSVHDIKSERLSSGLIQNGSFSKFPFVVELPAKASAESLKKQFSDRQARF